MPTEIRHPEWRERHEATKYPFMDSATLVSADGEVILDGVFLDASLYPFGVSVGLYISSVERTIENEVVITMADSTGFDQCSASFQLDDLNTVDQADMAFSQVGKFTSPCTNIGEEDDDYLLRVVDNSGYSAGIIVANLTMLKTFVGWPIGVQSFSSEDTEFVASVVVPTPDAGVRGFELDSGELVTGEVWLYGERGVILTCDTDTYGNTVIRVDVVGDPLFARASCSTDSGKSQKVPCYGCIDKEACNYDPTAKYDDGSCVYPPGHAKYVEDTTTANENEFITPRFIEAVTVQHGTKSFTCGPGEYNDFKITASSGNAADTILRVRPKEGGLIIETVGELLKGGIK
jgi:hypothetical protein